METPAGTLTKAEVEKIRQLPPGLVDKYVDYASSLTDAPKIFHYGCGLVLVSSVLGGLVTEPLLRSSPNLWVLLLGPTTIYRKTTSMRIAQRMIEEIDPNLIIASDFSPQALMSEFDGRSHIASVLVRDEVSGFFRSMNRHEYMTGTKEVLIKLFDGDSFKRKLRTEEFEIKDPYFVWLGGGVTEKIMDSITEEDILSGLMIRFVMLNPEERGPTRRLTYEDLESGWKREEIIGQLRLAQELLGTEWRLKIGPLLMQGQSPKYVLLNAEALDRFNTYIEGLEVLTRDPVIDKINSRIGPLVLKLSMIFAVDHLHECTFVLNTIIMGVEPVLKAIYWAEKFRTHNVRTLLGVSQTRRERKFERILTHIQMNPGIKRSRLMQRFKLSAREMDEVGATLRGREKVRVTVKVDGRRSAEVYFPR